jgi:hypothetical protein
MLRYALLCSALLYTILFCSVHLSVLPAFIQLVLAPSISLRYATATLCFALMYSHFYTIPIVPLLFFLAKHPAEKRYEAVCLDLTSFHWTRIEIETEGLTHKAQGIEPTPSAAMVPDLRCGNCSWFFEDCLYLWAPEKEKEKETPKQLVASDEFNAYKDKEKDKGTDNASDGDMIMPQNKDSIRAIVSRSESTKDRNTPLGAGIYPEESSKSLNFSESSEKSDKTLGGTIKSYESSPLALSLSFSDKFKKFRESYISSESSGDNQSGCSSKSTTDTSQNASQDTIDNNIIAQFSKLLNRSEGDGPQEPQPETRYVLLAPHSKSCVLFIT